MTYKQKLRETTIPTWIIQHIEEISMYDGWDIANGYELLFVERFTKDNDFASTLYEGGIEGVAQDENVQDDNNAYDNSNTDEYPDYPTGISLQTAAACGEIAWFPLPENPVELPGVPTPENPVEILGVAPPEKEVDENVATPLLPSDYGSDNGSDDKGEDTDRSTQQCQIFTHPEAIPQTVSKVYNIRPRKQT